MGRGSLFPFRSRLSCPDRLEKIELHQNPARLSDYPWIWVRVSCIYCQRRGRYHLARLAARYGSEIELQHLLKLIAGDCPWVGVQPRKYVAACGIYLPDLQTVTPPPPDLPPAMAGLKVIEGGRKAG